MIATAKKKPAYKPSMWFETMCIQCKQKIREFGYKKFNDAMTSHRKKCRLTQAKSS